MKFLIIIPAKDEEEFVEKTLVSLMEQTIKPVRVVLVDDGSKDNTPNIVKDLAARHPEIQYIFHPNEDKPAPGAKVVQAFNFGLKNLKEDLEEFDFIAKFDADLEFPDNYLEEIVKEFEKDPELGLTGGVCAIQVKGDEKVAKFTDWDHVRGALKCYRLQCFKDIGGLPEALGWDSIDEFRARYKGWKVKVRKDLVTKHFKVVNTRTNNYTVNFKNGMLFYRMRLGLLLGITSSAKRSLKFKPKGLSGILAFAGFLYAWMSQKPFLVSKEVGVFIRKYRYKRIKEKLI